MADDPAATETERNARRAGRQSRDATRAGAPFEEFVRRYQDMVFGTAVRLLGNTAEAEDIAQTVFLRLFERFRKISRSQNPAGWLKTVTRNACLNHLTRYRARWQFFSELERPHEEPKERVPLVSSFASPLALFEQADRAERLERALRRLPDHQRVPLVLFHFEEMSYDEIASVLGVSLGKVKTDIHRGRESLKKELAVLDGPR